VEWNVKIASVGNLKTPETSPDRVAVHDLKLNSDLL